MAPVNAKTRSVIVTVGEISHSLAMELVSTRLVDAVAILFTSGEREFTCFRVSDKSWAWQSATMGAPAFVPYEEVDRVR